MALALGFAGVSAAQVQGFHYNRDIQVAAPGWVRVPLDLAAIQHLSPGAADLHVFSPAGGEVPVWIEPAPPRIERRPVESVREERGGDGWQAIVDVGADPVPHERLFLTSALHAVRRRARGRSPSPTPCRPSASCGSTGRAAPSPPASRPCRSKP